MNDRVAQAQALHDLHRPGKPLVLYNIWDAGGARALEEAGAAAVATGSWSLAAAHGYADGEAIPFDFLIRVVARIAASVNCPVSVDFEGGYASDLNELSANVTELIQAGIVGINFEDGIVGGTGLHPVDAHCASIRAIRSAADAVGVPLFINARTDVFLAAPEGADANVLMDAALARQVAYADAGADGFFAPGLTDNRLIERLCLAADVPVNVMLSGAAQTVAALAALGVARVSYGPAPFVTAMQDLADRHRAAQPGR